MNKRIFLILFPILFLLFSSRGVDNFARHSGSVQGFCVSNVAIHHGHPGSSELKKQEKKVNKNAMRIKAWDGAFAVIIPAQWEPAYRISYFNKPANNRYAAVLLQAYASDHNLRGPPVATYVL